MVRISPAAALPLASMLLLDPAKPPGANFNLTTWNLGLPTGDATAHRVDTVSPAELAAGWQDIDTNRYFYTSPDDGAMVFAVPGGPEGTGCVTTRNSKHCRSELREILPDGGRSWDPGAAVNRLSATLAVTRADDSARGTVVGQIHMDAGEGTLPVCLISFAADGTVRVGVERDRSSGRQEVTELGRVEPAGRVWSYEVRYEKGGRLSVGLDGARPLRELGTHDLRAPRSYFKAGNYNQGNVSSEVRFYALRVEHEG